MLFYSQKCPTCRNLLMILKNENFLEYFKLVCVDTMLDKFPQDMVVPTMTVVNVNKPLIAQEAFEWIQQMKFLKQQNNTERKIVEPQITRGPVGYDEEIMGGISDKFALTKVDTPLPHAYFGVNDEEKNAIYTAPNEKDTIDKISQNRMMEELEIRENIRIINTSK